MMFPLEPLFIQEMSRCHVEFTACQVVFLYATSARLKSVGVLCGGSYPFHPLSKYGNTTIIMFVVMP